MRSRFAGAAVPSALLALIALPALMAVAPACSTGDSTSAAPSGAPRRSCTVTVWHKAATRAAVVEVVTSWEGWKRPGRMLTADRDDGYRVTEYDVPPGEQSYGIVEDGVWVTDAFVATTAFHDAHQVTWVDVAQCDEPAVSVASVDASSDGTAHVTATFAAARSGGLLAPASVKVTAKDGSAVAATATGDPSKGSIDLHLSGLAPGKHTLTVAASDDAGHAAESATATVWIEDAPFALEDSVIYQIMVDRYRGDHGVLADPPFPSARAGGNVRGVEASLDGIRAMGFNTLWLSPLYANPTGTYPGNDGRPYSSYHGYWPVQPRALEPAVATEQDLDALIADAHARGMRVLFDVVPNHVHRDHPYVAAHAGDGWFDDPDGTCVCGQGKCDWSSHILDCWFAPYLPDLDWTNPAVADQVSSDVRWWLDRFDGDGVRIDAIPMMPRAASRRISNAIRTKYEHPGYRPLILGENFTGPGSYDLLKYQLGPFGLDSEFHFPLMWAIRGAIASESQTFRDVESAIQQGAETWAGSGAVMALMIGNHDVTRFASESSGDAAGDGWDPAPTPEDPRVYDKQRLALGTIYALPGMPVVYYGDEIALPGRQDPDSRRVLPAESTFSDDQISVRDAVTAYGKARACLEPLRRGGYRTLLVDEEHLVLAREEAGHAPVVVVLTREGGPIAAPLPGIPAGDYVDALDGTAASLSPELTKLQPAPFSVHFYVPASTWRSLPPSCSR